MDGNRVYQEIDPPMLAVLANRGFLMRSFGISEVS